MIVQNSPGTSDFDENRSYIIYRAEKTGKNIHNDKNAHTRVCSLQSLSPKVIDRSDWNLEYLMDVCRYLFNTEYKIKGLKRL